MSFFDRLGRRTLEPEELKVALMNAVLGGDGPAFERLVRAYEVKIVELFPSWTRIDPARPPSREELDAYMHFIGTVAQYFDQVLGRPELWRGLTGEPEDNPIVQWERSLAEAQDLERRGEYAQAVALLEGVLENTNRLSGNAVDVYRPKTLGKLASSLFHSGRVSDARAAFERALALCESAGDGEGVRAYRSSLFEVCRYLGDSKAAVGHALALARLLGPDEGEWYATQASIVASGEPLLRMIVLMGDRQYELDDVPRPLSGRFECLFYRNRLELGGTRRDLEEGAKLASTGRFDDALARFAAAAALDTFDPQPHYESGVALLELGDPARALEAFERTERLAPGWFLCRSYGWLARELVAGRLGPWAVPLAFAVRDDASTAVEDRIELANEGLERAPDFEWLHVALARNMKSAGAADIESVCRHGLSLVREPCFKTELLFELANCLEPSTPEREALLREAATLGGSMMAASAAKLLLAPVH